MASVRKFLLLFFIFACFFSVHVPSVLAEAPSFCAIFSTLRIGSSGAEVECLQRKVGAVPDGKFGPLTRAAVLVWQARNRLVSDGIIGPLSRAVANRVPDPNFANFPPGCISFVGFSTLTGKKCDSSSILSTLAGMRQNLSPGENVTLSANPNLAKANQFIDTVLAVNREKGKSEEDLKLIAAVLRDEISNSKVDYNKEFEKVLLRDALNNQLSAPTPQNIFSKFVTKVFSFLGIMPPPVYAQTGTAFGGAVILPITCTASGGTMWMITITPLLPTNVALLTYIVGTQGFASYNIPYTTWLLGTYAQSGVCPMYVGISVVNINTQGTIMPTVGSSSI